MVSRVPARVWVKAGLGVIVLAVLAVLGFAVIAAVVAIAVVLGAPASQIARVIKAHAEKQPAAA